MATVGLPVCLLFFVTFFSTAACHYSKESCSQIRAVNLANSMLYQQKKEATSTAASKRQYGNDLALGAGQNAGTASGNLGSKTLESLVAFGPKVVIEVILATTIKANINAYSAVLEPSSYFNDKTNFFAKQTHDYTPETRAMQLGALTGPDVCFTNLDKRHSQGYPMWPAIFSIMNRFVTK